MPSNLTRTVGTFLGEVGGRVHFDIVPGNVSVFAGYEATWLDQVGLAPAQFLAGLGSVTVSNTPFIHGIVFGGQVRF